MTDYWCENNTRADSVLWTDESQ